MSSISIIIMSIIYAVSDILPLASSGHILLIEFLSSECEKANNLIFSMLKFAILAAVIIAMRKQLLSVGKTIIALVKDLIHKEFTFKTKDNDKKKTLILLTALIPMFFSFVLKGFVVGIYGSLLTVAIGFAVTGVLLALCDKNYQEKKEIRKVSYIEASSIGILQLFSIIPGVSSIGMMIFGCVMNKIKREDAVDFAFLLSIPIMLISFIKSLIPMISNKDYLVVNLVPYIIGMVLAGIIAYFAVLLVKKAVTSKKAKYFALYLFLMAGFVFLIWLRG